MNMICIRCGSADVRCRTMINPNTQVVEACEPENLRQGHCRACGQEVMLTAPETVRQEIARRYRSFIKENGHKPDYVLCSIVWRDDMNECCERKIQLSADSNPDVDDDIFYYCDNLADLLVLTEPGGEDFVVTGCLGFGCFTEEERGNKEVFDFDIEGETISVSGFEVRKFYAHQSLTARDIKEYAARNTAYAKKRAKCKQQLDADLIRQLLKGEMRMKAGETFCFRLQLHFAWYVQLTKEDERKYRPFRYALKADCLDNPQGFSRRYVSMEDALLHCLNGFNENASIPDRYKSIGHYLSGSTTREHDTDFEEEDVKFHL